MRRGGGKAGTTQAPCRDPAKLHVTKQSLRPPRTPAGPVQITQCGWTPTESSMSSQRQPPRGNLRSLWLIPPTVTCLTSGTAPPKKPAPPRLPAPLPREAPTARLPLADAAADARPPPREGLLPVGDPRPRLLRSGRLPEGCAPGPCGVLSRLPRRRRDGSQTIPPRRRRRLRPRTARGLLLPGLGLGADGRGGTDAEGESGQRHAA